MWLSSISNRTPKAYFLYMLTGACLLIVALSTAFFASDWRPFTLGSMSFLLPGLLVLLLSTLVNRIYVISDVFSRNTLWPGHAFILMAMTVGMEAAWQDIIIHGLGSVLIVNELLNVQYNRDARLHAFNIAFCIGIASFFEPTLILMSPFLLLGLRILKPLNFKEYALFLLGLGTPFYLLWSYAFLTGDYTQWGSLLPFHEWFGFPPDMHWSMWVRWLLALVIILVAQAAVFARYNALGVRSRRIATAIFYLQAGAVAVLLAGGGNLPLVVLYMSTAFAFPATLMMLSYFNKPFLELIHIIFVGIILTALLVGNI